MGFSDTCSSNGGKVDSPPGGPIFLFGVITILVHRVSGVPIGTRSKTSIATFASRSALTSFPLHSDLVLFLVTERSASVEW